MNSAADVCALAIRIRTWRNVPCHLVNHNKSEVHQGKTKFASWALPDKFAAFSHATYIARTVSAENKNVLYILQYMF